MPIKKKNALTPEQGAKAPLWREKWQGYFVDTAPANRKSAEAVVPSLYEFLDLKPPRHIKWWIGAPLALFREIEKAGATPIARSRIWQAYHQRVSDDEIASRIGRRAFSKLRARLFLPNPGWVTEIAPSASVHFGQMAEITTQLPFYDFCRSVGGVRRETEALVPAIKMAKLVGGVVVTPTTCYLMERWKHLALNQQGLPHSVTGPAISYRGADLYAYHGRFDEMLAVIFKHAKAGKLTFTEIVHAKRHYLRDFMIEVYGGGRANNGLEKLVADWNSLCSEPNASIIDHDPKIGTLHHVHFGELVVAVMEVVNSTPEPDGSYRLYWLRVPPQFKSARTAIAWTFRMPGKFYAPVKES